MKSLLTNVFNKYILTKSKQKYTISVTFAQVLYF